LTKLAELARLIRSKNAGPFELTFDIMFEDEARYRRVRESGALTREAVAQLYGLPAAQVKFFYVDNALAVKATIPRPATQGDLYDSDGHGGQQYAPLMDIEIPCAPRGTSIS
jgi:hypothetical protein